MIEQGRYYTGVFFLLNDENVRTKRNRSIYQFYNIPTTNTLIIYLEQNWKKIDFEIHRHIYILVPTHFHSGLSINTRIYTSYYFIEYLSNIITHERRKRIQFSFKPIIYFPITSSDIFIYT